MTTFACSEFVKRQTKESGYSHFDGSWEELAALAQTYYNTELCKVGYKDGVILIELPSEHISRFYSATVKITDKTKLCINWAPRREGELPVIRVSAKAKKQPAKKVELICYRADVLQEDSDRSSSADWEVIAIKARVSAEEEPMDPMTMARNFLHLTGGTKGEFSAQQFAESILYWNQHCMCAGKPKWYKKFLNYFK
jgi:hypothetical protein